MAMWGSCSFLITVFYKKAVVVGIVAVLVVMVSIYTCFRGSSLRGAVASFFSYMSYFIKCIFSVRCLILCVIVMSLVESVPKWVYWLSCWSFLIVCYDGVSYVLSGVEWWGAEESPFNTVYMGQGESTMKGSGSTGGGSNTPNSSGGSPDGPPVFSNVTDEENSKDEENDGSTDSITNVNEAPRDESQDGDVTPDSHATFEETGLLSDDDKEMVSTFNSMWIYYNFKDKPWLENCYDELSAEYFEGYKAGYYAVEDAYTRSSAIPRKPVRDLPHDSFQRELNLMFNLGARAGFLRGKSPYDLGVKLSLNMMKKRNLSGSMTKTEKALYRLGICVCITGLIIVGIEWLFG